jgi:hypothetical protein
VPLRIVKESDPVSITTLTIVIHAESGLGKSSLAYSCEEPLLLAFDPGYYRSKNRRNTVPVEKWEDATNLSASDLSPYKEVVVDTAGFCIDSITQSALGEGRKWGNAQGALSIQGYGYVKNVFEAFLGKLRSFGKDVVILSHSDEQKKKDDFVVRLDIPGGSKNTLYKLSDVMGRLYLVNGKRMLDFSPSESSFGKNPGQLPVLEVPDFEQEPKWFAGVIQRIKDTINSQSASQMAAAEFIKGWSDQIAAATSNEHCGLVLGDIQSTEMSATHKDLLKRMLLDRSKTLGLQWDAEKKVFVKAKAEKVAK